MEEIEFYAVIGTYKKDGKEKEWVQSTYFDIEKAHTAMMANGMAGIGSGGMDWRVDKCYAKLYASETIFK
jgi:hypothetical protein